jgi:hypothetical protein
MDALVAALALVGALVVAIAAAGYRHPRRVKLAVVGHRRRYADGHLARPVAPSSSHWNSDRGAWLEWRCRYCGEQHYQPDDFSRVPYGDECGPVD